MSQRVSSRWRKFWSSAVGCVTSSCITGSQITCYVPDSFQEAWIPVRYKSFTHACNLVVSTFSLVPTLIDWPRLDSTQIDWFDCRNYCSWFVEISFVASVVPESDFRWFSVGFSFLRLIYLLISVKRLSWKRFTTWLHIKQRNCLFLKYLHNIHNILQISSLFICTHILVNPGLFWSLQVSLKYIFNVNVNFTWIIKAYIKVTFWLIDILHERCDWPIFDRF